MNKAIRDYKVALDEITEGDLSKKELNSVNSTLTVKDLREMLKDVDEDLPVVVRYFEDGTTFKESVLRYCGTTTLCCEKVDATHFIVEAVEYGNLDDYKEEQDID